MPRSASRNKRSNGAQKWNPTLCHSPLKTLYCFLSEVLYYILLGYKQAINLSFKAYFILVSFGISVLLILVLPFEPFTYAAFKLKTAFFWLFLGILSSIGLGFGLHTFILYLAPFVARVTMAAFECGSLEFPRPPYPGQIVCPIHFHLQDRHHQQHQGENREQLLQHSFSNVSFSSSPPLMSDFKMNINLTQIFFKVLFESVFWGVGTAIGELPPYFVARLAAIQSHNSNLHSSETTAAVRVGNDSGKADDREHQEKLYSASSSSVSTTSSSYSQRIRNFVRAVIERVGFLGILLFASIPNPLFDLAGLTCGHFLISFWTFFGATLIGKAFIKAQLQTFFVIFLFSGNHIKMTLRFFEKSSIFAFLHGPLKSFITRQYHLLHPQKSGKAFKNSLSGLEIALRILVASLIFYFVVSIIHSLAQTNVKRRRSSGQRIETL